MRPDPTILPGFLAGSDGRAILEEGYVRRLILGDLDSVREIWNWTKALGLETPFVLENGRAVQRTIEVGHENGLAAEVRAGLAQGETVILHPPATLTDGMRVRAGS